MHDRFNGHKRDIKHGISTNVADHFFSLVGCDFDTKCKLYPLEKLPQSGLETEEKQYCLERENYWIQKLETYDPYGLNTGYDPNKDGVIPFVISRNKQINATKIFKPKTGYAISFSI